MKVVTKCLEYSIVAKYYLHAYKQTYIPTNKHTTNLQYLSQWKRLRFVTDRVCRQLLLSMLYAFNPIFGGANIFSSLFFKFYFLQSLFALLYYFYDLIVTYNFCRPTWGHRWESDVVPWCCKRQMCTCQLQILPLTLKLYAAASASCNHHVDSLPAQLSLACLLAQCSVQQIFSQLITIFAILQVLQKKLQIKKPVLLVFIPLWQPALALFLSNLDCIMF